MFFSPKRPNVRDHLLPKRFASKPNCIFAQIRPYYLLKNAYTEEVDEMKLGIVGLPNVGKSTLFNAITRAGAQAANYPFCTIEPNTGVVPVPD